jgi:hypothetical protein
MNLPREIWEMIFKIKTHDAIKNQITKNLVWKSIHIFEQRPSYQYDGTITNHVLKIVMPRGGILIWDLMRGDYMDGIRTYFTFWYIAGNFQPTITFSFP